MCIDSEIVQCCMCKDPEFNQFNAEDVETVKTFYVTYHFCEQHQLALHNEGIKTKGDIYRFLEMCESLRNAAFSKFADFEDLTMENIRILTQVHKIVYGEG